MAEDLKEPEDEKPSEFAESVEEYWRLMRRERENEDSAYGEYSDESGYAAQLRQSWDSYSADANFTDGDLVQWKPRLKNRRFPHYGKPAVVIRRLSKPVVTDAYPDSAFEDLDLIVGILDGDGELRVFPCNSARLTGWGSESSGAVEAPLIT